MSLRAKVLLLFLTLAVVPLVVVTVFDYFQSMQSLEGLVRAQNRGIADVAARELGQLRERRGEELDALVRDPSVARLLRGGPGAADAEQEWQRVASVVSGWLIGAELRDSDDRLVASTGDMAAGAREGCPGDDGRVLMVRDVRVGRRGERASVRALVDAEALFPVEALSARVGSAGFVAVVDRRNGRVVYRGRCDVPPGTAGAILGVTAGDADGLAELESARDIAYGDRVSAVAPLAGSDWSVVATALPAEFTGPFSRARFVFVLLVLFVGAAASLAFTMLLGRITRSLRDLSDAAGEVAAGNYTPVLPPPGPDEVGRLSYSLGVMAGKVQRTLRQIESTRQLATMGEFAAKVSHEIRNPLSSIRLNLQGMERDVRRGSADDSFSEPLQLCLKEVDRLDRVVRGMLGLAREEPMRRRPCSVHAILGDAIGVLRAELEGQDVRVEKRLAAERDDVIGDEGQLRGVVMNLMLNAAQAMPEGGTIHISTATDAAAGGDIIRVRVADDGPGIPREVRDQIFRPFMTTKASGTGLGLPIARRTAEQHGGTLYLEERSALQHGAEFVLALPLQQEGTAANGPEPDRRAGPSFDRGRLVGAPPATVAHNPISATAMSRRILVVDDDESHRKTLERFLSTEDCEVMAVDSAERALGVVSSYDPHLVITDIKMPGMSGFDLIRRLREASDDRDVVMITAFEDMKTAIEAMKVGAYDFLVKPLDLDQIEAVVERCFRDRAFRRRARQLSEDAAGDAALDTLVGRDPRMIEIYKLIGKVSQTSTPVLIRGDTGTGKELIARALHYNSPRAHEPFVAVNCTALPETLLESELFGHVKGAFTGAVGERRGRFEMAGSGTIFLDEIGDTSPTFQGELLRVLQEGEFHPVGAERVRKTDARVIAATHRNVEQAVKEGDFREDLYFRLRVVEITVPPLRDRRADIPLLAQHIVNKTAKRLHKPVYVIPDPVMAELLAYDWPGNVRELENSLTRAIVLAQGHAISADHLVLGTSQTSAPRFDELETATLDAVEGAHVQRILARTGGNKTRAAEILGISRPRLDRIIERHELYVP